MTGIAIGLFIIIKWNSGGAKKKKIYLTHETVLALLYSVKRMKSASLIGKAT